MPLVLCLMNILVTAGNTQVLIDRVRCLTNVFSGRTGTRIALHAHDRGHAVTLLTSRPQVVQELRRDGFDPGSRWSVRSFQTFEDLQILMAEEVSQPGPGVLIHAAAVSDYLSGGIYAPAPGISFHPEEGFWETPAAQPAQIPRSHGRKGEE